jgi:hypothetical protein
MASRAASVATLLLAISLLLPLRLLSHALRPRFSHPSAAALLTVAALVSAICAAPDPGALPGVATSADADADALRSEIEALRLKVAQLGEIAFLPSCLSIAAFEHPPRNCSANSY